MAERCDHRPKRLAKRGSLLETIGIAERAHMRPQSVTVFDVEGQPYSLSKWVAHSRMSKFDHRLPSSRRNHWVPAWSNRSHGPCPPDRRTSARGTRASASIQLQRGSRERRRPVRMPARRKSNSLPGCLPAPRRPWGHEGQHADEQFDVRIARARLTRGFKRQTRPRMLRRTVAETGLGPAIGCRPSTWCCRTTREVSDEGVLGIGRPRKAGKEPAWRRGIPGRSVCRPGCRFLPSSHSDSRASIGSPGSIATGRRGGRRRSAARFRRRVPASRYRNQPRGYDRSGRPRRP